MREIGPFEKTPSSQEARPKRWPKPDVGRTRLTAQELHAYYIAVISSRAISVDTKDLHLKAS